MPCGGDVVPITDTNNLHHLVALSTLTVPFINCRYHFIKVVKWSKKEKAVSYFYKDLEWHKQVFLTFMIVQLAQIQGRSGK